MIHCWYCGAKYPASDKHLVIQAADGYWCKDADNCVATAAEKRGR